MHIIKQLRLGRGLTQRAVSKATGITSTMLGRYENRKENPNWEALQKLSTLFEVAISELI